MKIKIIVLISSISLRINHYYLYWLFTQLLKDVNNFIGEISKEKYLVYWIIKRKISMHVYMYFCISVELFYSIKVQQVYLTKIDQFASAVAFFYKQRKVRDQINYLLKFFVVNVLVFFSEFLYKRLKTNLLIKLFIVCDSM